LAVNAAIDYGTDIGCGAGTAADPDELFTEISGLACVRQDALHSILCDNFLGEGGAERGFDCRKLIGIPPAELPGYGPIIEDVLCYDDRINSAAVTLTATKRANGTADGRLDATCQTDAGPFALTIPSLADLTLDALEGQTR
jgi:hypothetical protein